MAQLLELHKFYLKFLINNPISPLQYYKYKPSSKKTRANESQCCGGEPNFSEFLCKTGTSNQKNTNYTLFLEFCVAYGSIFYFSIILFSILGPDNIGPNSLNLENLMMETIIKQIKHSFLFSSPYLF